MLYCEKSWDKQQKRVVVLLPNGIVPRKFFQVVLVGSMVASAWCLRYVCKPLFHHILRQFFAAIFHFSGKFAAILRLFTQGPILFQ